MASRDTIDFEVLVIGAGFGGLYASHKLRALGFSFQTVEMGDGVGGTWYWNRYPGARVDLESLEYSYSFSKEIEQEWVWTEIMPAQPEIEAYANFVCDRLDLRKHIKFETKVVSLHWDEKAQSWTATTDKGDRWTCRFVITAVGCLSAPLMPAIEGIQSFKGDTLFTNTFPKHGYDFSGKRVAVVGTGSSGVQAIPVIAETAKTLTVFQRSAAYTRPANNRPYHPGELDGLKANYEDIRRRQLQAFAGTIRFGALPPAGPPPTRKILETPLEERMAAVENEGWGAPSAWADILTDIEANKAAQQLYGKLVGKVVEDADTAKSLTPLYPIGCKRPCIDTGYFETYNLPHVKLVDLKKGAIKRVTEQGIETEQGAFAFDVIVYATGFDAVTGALNRIDIRGKGGEKLRERWETEGPRTYLGLQARGFPNLFTITGPLSPAVLANMILAVEQHMDWIGDLLVHMRAKGLSTVEPEEDAVDAWVEHNASVSEGTVATDPSCNSWYVGANVPGKARIYMNYRGGFPVYREKCAEIAARGYEGFALA